MVRRAVALSLVLLLVWVPYAHATAAGYTDTGYIGLTTSGLAAVAAAETKVAKAVAVLGVLGRLAGPISVGIVVISTSMAIWDWYARTYGPMPSAYNSNPPLTSWGVTGVSSGAGYTITIGAYERWYDTGTRCVSYIRTDGGAGFLLVGVVVSRDVTMNCPNRADYYFMYNTALPTVPSSPAVVGAVSAQAGQTSLSANLASTKAALQAPLGSTAIPMINSFPVDKRADMIAIIDDAQGVVTSGVTLGSGDVVAGTVNPPTNQGAVPVPGTAATTAPALSAGDVQAALTAALAANPGITQAQVQAAMTAALAANPGITQAQVEAAMAQALAENPGITASQMQTALGLALAPAIAALQAQQADAQAVPAPADTTHEACPECITVTWASLFGDLTTAASGVPLFGLLSGLVMPTYTGSNSWRQATFTVGGHSFSFNLDTWGVGTVVTMLRFAVLGCAVIAAYFIVFA